MFGTPLRLSDLSFTTPSRRACWLIIAGMLPALAGCDRDNTYTLATHQEPTRIPQIGADIAEVLEEQNGWEMTVLSGPEYYFASNVGLVDEGKVDFAVTSSDVAVEAANVRTVLPIYPEILVVLYAESLGNPQTLEELLRGRKVGVGPKELPYSKYLLKLIRDFGIDQATFTPVYHPMGQVGLGTGQMDVLFTFIGSNPVDLAKLIEAGNRFFSFDDPNLVGRGSRVDGYLMYHPDLQSFVLPKNTFGTYPSKPVLTIAVPMTLITQKDMGDDVVYDFVAAILENSSRLFRKNPVLGYLSQDFAATKLNFPLHEGTQQYLNRDQPTFLERYAEVMALILSAFFVLAGGLGSLARLMKKRRKDRIDTYYDQLLSFGKQSPGSREEVEKTLVQLAELKVQALDQLQSERLSADDSFSIFVELLHYEIARLERLRDVVDPMPEE